MIKVKEMKKLIERVEEFLEYEILFDESVCTSSINNNPDELDLKLDHKGNNILVFVKGN
jgi:hypothetical protein